MDNTVTAKIFARGRKVISNWPPHSERQVIHSKKWKPVPVWSWRYWMGSRWQRWTWDNGSHMGNGEYDGYWTYVTDAQKARIFLEEQFNGEA